MKISLKNTQQKRHENKMPLINNLFLNLFYEFSWVNGLKKARTMINFLCFSPRFFLSSAHTFNLIQSNADEFCSGKLTGFEEGQG